jgi:hypothetical protein
VSVDIFALGVMIFMIVVGKVPFNKASCSSDAYYKLFCENNDFYWKKIES